MGYCFLCSWQFIGSHCPAGCCTLCGQGDLLELLWAGQEQQQGGVAGTACGEGSDSAKAVEAFIMAANIIHSSGYRAGSLWQVGLPENGAFCSALGLPLAVAGLRRCSECDGCGEQQAVLLSCMEHLAGRRALEPAPEVALWAEAVCGAGGGRGQP